jgi:hypothetical protein
LDILIRPDASSSIDTVIDRQRQYGRTRLARPGVRADRTEGEACIELLFGARAPRPAGVL